MAPSNRVETAPCVGMAKSMYIAYQGLHKFWGVQGGAGTGLGGAASRALLWAQARAPGAPPGPSSIALHEAQVLHGAQRSAHRFAHAVRRRRRRGAGRLHVGAGPAGTGVGWAAVWCGACRPAGGAACPRGFCASGGMQPQSSDAWLSGTSASILTGQPGGRRGPDSDPQQRTPPFSVPRRT